MTEQKHDHSNESPKKAKASHPLARKLWLVCGCILTGIGLVGVFTPILPTTGFVVAAAWCFGRSSPRLERMLVNNPLLGPYILAYTEKRGLSIPRKIWILSILWAGMGMSIFLVEKLWLDMLLAAIGIGVSIHVITIKTPRPEQSQAE